MPERRSNSNRSPKYRRQRRRGSPDRAFVEIDGNRRYLGDFDSPESREAYRRLIVEWATGGAYTAVPQDEITVIELADRFWQHAQRYYRNADGSLTTTPTVGVRTAAAMDTYALPQGCPRRVSPATK